jgi:hypothetical protein
MSKKIKLIEEAIEKALRRESGLTPLAMSVPALSSLRIRHLMNNLGNISTRYLEVGVHKSGLFCSTISNNSLIIAATAIDNWASDEDNIDKAEPQFDENTAVCKPWLTEFSKIKSDAFHADLTKILGPIDLYLYDAGHSYFDQSDALGYYKSVLADEFIYCCDDWTYGDVKKGTLDGLDRYGLEIIHKWELINETPGDGHLNEEWWRGYGVFLLKKKS